MIRTVFLLLCVALIVSAQRWTSSSWSDTVESGGYGGTLYICVDGSEVNGAYSEYGIIQGELFDSSSLLSGRFYEGGAGAFSCVTGSFSLKISNDGQTFTGTYTCADDEDGTEYPWDEQRVGNTPTNLQCAVLGTELAAGFFNDGEGYRNYMCIDDNDYEASYELEDGTEGYEYGVVYSDGLINSGVYQESDGSVGISLFFSLPDGSVGNFYWEIDDDGHIDTEEDANSDLHGYDLLNRAGTSTDADCYEFAEYAVNDFFNYYFYDYESSGAVVLSIAGVFTIAVALLAF